MVVASYCETLRILRNMNFNVPLYERDTSIVFNLGINTTLSRSGFKILRSFVGHEIWPETTKFCGSETYGMVLLTYLSIYYV